MAFELNLKDMLLDLGAKGKKDIPIKENSLAKNAIDHILFEQK